MSIVSKTTLKSYFETGDKPTEGEYIDLIDSLAHTNDVPVTSSTLNQVELSASGETSLWLTYSGSSAPTMSKDAAGTFRLTVAAGVIPVSFNWKANNTNLTAGNEIKLIIEDDDEQEWFLSCQILALGSNQLADMHGLGTAPTESETAAGEVTVTWPNMNGFGASGFKIFGNFHYSEEVTA